MIPEAGGWFVTNIKDATWVQRSANTLRCRLEPPGARWEGTGIGISVLHPGQPACLYHRENAQEDFLVLSGECVLVVNGEERQLRAWDFVHCPPGVSHVFVGAGDGPCAILMIGDRPADHRAFYPRSPLAAKYGAETPVETQDPKAAYVNWSPYAPCEPPRWPLNG